MYRLFGAPGRASAAPEAMLEEIAAPYEYVEVDADARRGAAYRALNPLGQVPTLVDGDRVIWEAAAICIYLCDRHPAAELAPPAGSPERGRFYQWLFFLSNTLQPAYMQWFYPERYCGDPASAVRVADEAARRIGELWQLLDDALEPGPYLVGERRGACDLYLYMLASWHRESIVPLARFARVSRLIEAVAACRGARQMMVRNAGK